MMSVWCERGFGHGVEGLLHGERVVLGEGGDQRFAQVGADLVEVDAGSAMALAV